MYRLSRANRGCALALSTWHTGDHAESFDPNRIALPPGQAQGPLIHTPPPLVPTGVAVQLAVVLDQGVVEPRLMVYFVAADRPDLVGRSHSDPQEEVIK